MNTEYIDIVNDDDTQVVGVKTLDEVYEQNLLAHTRGVKLFIVNKNRELLMAKRSSHKKRDAGKLDSPMTGHVRSGETYEQALKREVQEELRINIDDYSYRCLGKLSAQDGVFSFVTVYELELDFIPEFNTDDFEEMFWMVPVQLITKMTQGLQVRKSLPIWLKHFYLYCANCATMSL